MSSDRAASTTSQPAATAARAVAAPMPDDAPVIKKHWPLAHVISSLWNVDSCSTSLPQLLASAGPSCTSTRIAISPAEAGPIALAVSSRPERLTAEIAELGFLGGEVRGHIALDMTGVLPHASARLSGENLDSAGLLALAEQRDWLRGAADVNAEAEATLDDPSEFMERLVAHARVNFPEGGQMRARYSAPRHFGAGRDQRLERTRSDKRRIRPAALRPFPKGRPDQLRQCGSGGSRAAVERAR